MRFILTGAVWVVILSLVTMLFSVRGEDTAVTHKKEAEKKFAVAFEVTTTFSVEEDPFALDIGDEKGAFSMVMDGSTIYSTEKDISDRVTFTTQEYDVSSGKHELFIKANPSNTDLSNSVRVRVLASGNPVSDETFWFSPGQTVNASLIFNLAGKEEHDEH